ncbi:MAG: hypothetical protein ABJE95_36020 [Byssovorax sp.]
MTAARKLEPSPDPVHAPASDQPLGAEQRAEVERALVEIAAGRIPPFSCEDVRRTIEDRLRAEQEVLDAESDELSPEELDELERRSAEAEKDLGAGQYVTAEKFFADRGIPWRPAPR